MPFRWLLDEREGFYLPADNAKVFRAGDDAPRRGRGETGGRIDGISIRLSRLSVFRNSLFACSKARVCFNCLWSVLLIHGGWERTNLRKWRYFGEERGRKGRGRRLKDFWILPIRSYNPGIFESGRV